MTPGSRPSLIRIPTPAAAAERHTVTSCPVCRHEHFTYQFTQAGLPIVRCDGCALLLRNPQPSADELSHIEAAQRPADGSDVRVLLATRGGSMAHFTLAPGATSVAVAHRTIDEAWFFLSGRGEMWRRLCDHEEIVTVEPGVCLTIPVGTRFQYRTIGAEPLTALGVATPPWPGDGEAYRVEDHWPA